MPCRRPLPVQAWLCFQLDRTHPGVAKAVRQWTAGVDRAHSPGAHDRLLGGEGGAGRPVGGADRVTGGRPVGDRLQDCEAVIGRQKDA
ncbi:hypothetical protein ACFY1U_40810 [Streptomyces sp. NPDC001351]|uniref:hypothetical protein n=1 Tax=Streptomyces sp. NPDC001351 TaxID=3364564 RepID=UPI00368721EF